MFRPQRRVKRVISDEAAKKLLADSKRAVLAVNGDEGYPYAIPINYFYSEKENKIFFHGSKVGHKIDSIKKDDKVCLCVYGDETFEEGDWAPYLKSAVVFGRCSLITDVEILTPRVRELARRFYPTEEEMEAEIARDIQGVCLYEVSIEHLSGKRIHEK